MLALELGEPVVRAPVGQGSIGILEDPVQLVVDRVRFRVGLVGRGLVDHLAALTGTAARWLTENGILWKPRRGG